MKHPVLPRLLLHFTLLSTLLALFASAAPEAWLKEIDALTAHDATQPPAKGGVVFVGSSSIRLWKTLAEDFPGVPVINRGFGGSELADSVFYLDRVVLPYQPRRVVVFAGTNDLKNGRTPEAVAADFKAFRTRLHAALPEAKLLYLSITLAPSRANIHDAMRKANRLIAADCATDPRCTFVDINTPMAGDKPAPGPELFVEDQLHLNPAGYAIWTKVLAPHITAK
ncbi:SGNH/GDSL hydrolase family protein [Oleiharenicola lentus]|uniref:SGNH/GDSL hydrolase family protein n=1 Tax=Oleiharenicola lentus TaxID=2508720 RepID=UPI0013E97207|nr:SGNH/GDSL hydrolase family protein [Oleiharenicola lentus]